MGFLSLPPWIIPMVAAVTVLPWTWRSIRFYSRRSTDREWNHSVMPTVVHKYNVDLRRPELRSRFSDAWEMAAPEALEE